MDFIEDMVKEKLSDEVMKKLGDQFGLDSSKTGDVVDKALPMILGGLGKNAEKDAESIDKALEKDHDGSILDRLKDVVTQDSEKVEGAKILGHIFGSSTDDAVEATAKSSGVDSNAAGGILAVLAPIIMGELGKQKKDKGFDLSDLTDLLGKEKKNSDSKLTGILGMLDRDKDGSVIDDATDLLGAFFKK